VILIVGKIILKGLMQLAGSLRKEKTNYEKF